MYRIRYRFLAAKARLAVRSGRVKDLEIIVLRHPLAVLSVSIESGLATRGLRDVVAAWERDHGAFSDEELAAARSLVDG